MRDQSSWRHIPKLNSTNYPLMTSLNHSYPQFPYSTSNTSATFQYPLPTTKYIWKGWVQFWKAEIKFYYCSIEESVLIGQSSSTVETRNKIYRFTQGNNITISPSFICNCLMMIIEFYSDQLGCKYGTLPAARFMIYNISVLA